MEKENFAEQVSNDLGFSRLVQHIKNKEPMLFVFLHKAEYTPEVNHTRQMELKGIVKRAHFGTNRITGYYLDAQGKQHDVEALVLFGKREREQELKDLAIGIGKKYAMDYVLFTNAEGRTMEISTQKDGLGSELEVPNGLTLEDLQRYFSYIGQRKFVIKSISEPEQLLYGSWMNAMLCNSWQVYAKKHGADALEVWESRIR